MANVNRNRKYDVLVKSLTEPHNSYQKSVFPTIMELLIFAAMIGYQEDRKEKAGSDTLEVPTRIFENNKMEIYLYLTALVDSKNMDILREEKESEMLTIFEDYANGGLAIMEEWREAMPSDTVGNQMLMQKITAMLIPDELIEHDYQKVTF